MTRDTVGKLSTDLLSKLEPNSINVIDQMRENTKEFVPGVLKCIEESKTIFPGNFFIKVILKAEPLMPNVWRFYFEGEGFCPTPDYDQTIYFYDRKEESIVLLWTIPDRESCHYLLNNALYLPSGEKQLLNYVMLFRDKSLFKLAKKLSKEAKDSILIVD